jgi:TRAP-type mannitol/chloroaromatic compound transport system substrate-binding protein
LVKKRILLIPLTLVLAMSLIVIGCPPVEPVEVPEPEPVPIFNWRAQSIYPSGFTGFEINQRFVDRIRELSGGRLNIILHPIGAIVPAFESFDAVSDRVIEMHLKTPLWWGGIEPVMPIFTGLPAGLKYGHQIDSWFWNQGGIEIAREAYARHNIYFVGPLAFGRPPLGAEILHSRIPIRTVEDISGLKVRSAGVGARYFATLGASIVTVPGPEIYTALMLGTVEAAEYLGAATNWEYGLHEVAPYVILPGLHARTMVDDVAVNMDAWKELPADLQAILEAVTREFSQVMANEFELRDHEAIRKMEEFGIEIIEWSPAEVTKATSMAMRLWEELAARDPLSAKAVESQMAYMRLVGIIE